jgi:DNA replication and repair protein RecF
MALESVLLTNFRNYTNQNFSFGAETTVLLGPNASGKTNVLEAIYMLATGESFRAGKIEEMIGWDSEVAHVTGICAQGVKHVSQDHGQISNVKFLISNQIPMTNDQMSSNDKITDRLGHDTPWTVPSVRRTGEDDGGVELRVTLTRGMVQGKRVSKRRYVVNGVPRRKQDLVGNFFCVAFRPQDLRLVEGSPSRRRYYLDEVLMQIDREYRRSAMNYEQGLRRRNRLLTQIRDRKMPVTTLEFWNRLLVKEGEQLRVKRQEYIDFVNQAGLIGGERGLVYQPSVITEKRVVEYLDREILAGHTLIGPHKDDFRIVTSDKLQGTRDLAIYGSRGEQRMAVLWMKLAEMAFVESRVGERPTLLLDDIFSELDDEHDGVVMGLLGQQQAVVATTEVPEAWEKRAGVTMHRLPVESVVEL